MDDPEASDICSADARLMFNLYPGGSVDNYPKKFFYTKQRYGVHNIQKNFHELLRGCLVS